MAAPKNSSAKRSPARRTDPFPGKQRIYQVDPDGLALLCAEPPHRLLFSWDISPTWQIEPDPANTSEVEVRFIAETPDRTRVEVEHRHLDRHGEGWEGVREGVASNEGWPLYLRRYAKLLAPEG